MKQKYQNNDYKAQKKPSIALFFMAILLCACLIYNYNNLKLGLRINSYDKIIAGYEQVKKEQCIQKLLDINENFVAWLTCDGANISIPVVKTQTKDDENFYLDHDFEKYSNPLGIPYQKHNCNIDTTTNTVFVGHSAYTQTWIGNQTTQAVFGNLQNYLSKNLNLNVSVQTLQTTYNYKIISAFSFDSENYDDDDIIAYTTTNITTQSQFNNFYNNIIQSSAIDTGVTATFGDKFLTLFTCSANNLQNRIVIVAKLIV